MPVIVKVAVIYSNVIKACPDASVPLNYKKSGIVNSVFSRGSFEAPTGSENNQKRKKFRLNEPIKSRYVFCRIAFV